MPRDTAAKDTTADSLKVKKDTVEARFAQAEMPHPLEIGESYTWDRTQLFNTGALTLVDVLNRVPGLTVFQSGWIASPQYIAYLGNPTRVRIFFDGVEVMVDRQQPEQSARSRDRADLVGAAADARARCR